MKKKKFIKYQNLDQYYWDFGLLSKSVKYVPAYLTVKSGLFWATGRSQSEPTILLS